MMTNLFHFLKLLFTRVAILYAVIFLLSSWLINNDVVKMGMVVRTLNELMPAAYTSLSAYNQEIPADELERYIQYYERVTSYFPHEADAFGLLGYCYYKKGATARAAALLDQAQQLNSHFFWFPYNLGLLLYKTGQYERAVPTLKKSLETKPDLALAFFKTSRLYQHIFMKNKLTNEEIAGNLKQGYQRSFELLIASYYQLKDYPSMYQIAAYARSMKMEDAGRFGFWAGLAQFYLKDYASSAWLFRESVKQNPQNAQAFYYLTLSLKQLGQEKLAEAALMQAVVLNKKDPARDETEVSYELQIY